MDVAVDGINVRKAIHALSLAIVKDDEGLAVRVGLHLHTDLAALKGDLQNDGGIGGMEEDVSELYGVRGELCLLDRHHPGTSASTHTHTHLPPNLPPSFPTYLVGQTERTDVLLVLHEQLYNVVLEDFSQSRLVLEEFIHPTGLVKRLVRGRVQAENTVFLREGLVQASLGKGLGQLVEFAVCLDSVKDINLGVAIVYLTGVVVAAGLDRGRDGRDGGGRHACEGEGRERVDK